MPINTDALGTTSEPRKRSWTSKDALLYALGVGAGMDDPTGAELEFTTENSRDRDPASTPHDGGRPPRRLDYRSRSWARSTWP